MHIIASVNNLSVCRFPVSVTFDCGNHLLFDLTHESEEKGLGLWWGGLPSTSIQYTILGVVPVLCATLSDRHTRFHLFLYSFPPFIHNITRSESSRSMRRLAPRTTMAARKIMRKCSKGRMSYLSATRPCATSSKNCMIIKGVCVNSGRCEERQSCIVKESGRSLRLSQDSQQSIPCNFIIKGVNIQASHTVIICHIYITNHSRMLPFAP